MANLHALAGTTRIPGLVTPEAIVATTPDGPDARVAAIERLTRFTTVLELDRSVVEAIDIRIKKRPPIAQPTTLQDLIRAGRRRLDRERVGQKQQWIGVRLDAVHRLQKALRP